MVLTSLVLIVGILILAYLLRRKAGSRQFPYHSVKYLLSKAERSFYGVLIQAAGGEYLVFAKVRVADVILPKKGLSRADWQRAFNAVSAKHFDFLVCDPQDCSVKAALELDDGSHGSSKTQKRDRFLNAACESAGIPLLRIKASKSYAIASIRKQLQEAVGHSPGSRGSHASVLAPGAAAETEYPDREQPTGMKHQELATPSCPKCGEAMILRKAKSGSNVGQTFWGCSGFPSCRGVVALES